MAKKKSSMLGNMIGMGVTNLVGVGLIGASANAVAALPAGTAKNIAGVVPGLQSTALMSANLGMLTGGKKKKKGSYL